METLNVLIVDDEPGMRMGIRRALDRFVLSLPDIETRVGFRPQVAGDGAGARKVLQQQSVDLVLLDHKLPDTTGLDLLNEFNPTRATDMITIMVTAHASLDTAVNAIKRGAYDFLAKPFTPLELRETVGKGARALIMARKARELARERRRVRFEFIRVLGHELQSPLGAIQGYLELLRDGAASRDPESARMMVERSLVRTDQMRKLIADLLDMTRIESGRMQRSLQAVNVYEAARVALENVAAEAARRHIRLHPIHATGTMQITAVPDEIQMLLNNLVSNAVKYNRDEGSVSVRLTDLGDRIKIEVQDSGIGLTDDERGRLFEEFSRIRNAKTRHILGSGLGLSIVRKIVDLYAGEITVRSAPDHGSTFSVLLAKSRDHG